MTLVDPDDHLNPARPELFGSGKILEVFGKLRRIAPVHWTSQSIYGPFWSITRPHDIRKIEADNETFSSDIGYGGITIFDQRPDFPLPMFIAMDPPEHSRMRANLRPSVGPDQLELLRYTIRAQTVSILSGLREGEVFDWVEKISVEISVQLLSALLGMPWKDRHRLARWADVATATPGYGLLESEEQRERELSGCRDYFKELCRLREFSLAPDGLLGYLCGALRASTLSEVEFFGNIVLLIVGGSETMRHSISAIAVLLSQFPETFTIDTANKSSDEALAAEIFRWQTPLAHMRRTATRDVVFGGKSIRKGEKVVLWYLAANRDGDTIEEPDRFNPERPNPKAHLAFGFGIHRCFGERLAYLQMSIFLSELRRVIKHVEVVEEPTRLRSCFVNGFERVPVKVTLRR